MRLVLRGYTVRTRSANLGMVADSLWMCFDSSSAACRYRARSGNVMGNVGHGSLYVAGMIYACRS